MKKLIALLAIVVIGFTANAQTGITPKALIGNSVGEYHEPSPDTVVKSTTYFLTAPLYVDNKGFNNDVSFTVSMDSVAGTPDMSVTTWMSNDNLHWTVVNATPIVFNSAKNYWHVSSTVPSVSDSAVSVNTNPWTGKFIGFKLIVNSNTQRAKYHIVLKTFKTY